MPEWITAHIQQFYDNIKIKQIIDESENLTRQFNEPDVLNNQVCVVLPVVRRNVGYQTNQLDLDLFIKHGKATELGQLEMYRVRDFIRQRVDMAPVLHTAHMVTGVDVHAVAETIKRQIKFLQRPENRDLPIAPAQMINGQQ